MESDKRAHHHNNNKSHEESSSDPHDHNPSPRASKKRPGKQHKLLDLRTAECSEDEWPDKQDGRGMAKRDNHAADIGNAGEWPVTTKEDSAGPPVRKELSGGKEDDKKVSPKRPPPAKPSKKRDKGQPPSSDENKPSEKASECTTKRNLHLIKTERARRKSEEDRASDDNEKEEGRKRGKKKKKRKKRSTEKTTEKENADKATKKKASTGTAEDKRATVERESIHLDKQKQQQQLREGQKPRVEREAIAKPEGWHDVEREPLYNIIPQYDNLPEDTLMRALKPPPVDPNSNPFTPRPDSNRLHAAAAATTQRGANTTTLSEPTDKKAVTEREKREQISIGTEWSDVTEGAKPSFALEVKKFLKHPHWCVWIWIVGLFIVCFCLCGVITAQGMDLKRLRNSSKNA